MQSELAKRRQAAGKCMKCGFCSFHCPVYAVELVESSVARGRQMFIRNVLEGKQLLTPALADKFDRCTLCRLCEYHCPAKAPTPELVMAMRADLVKERGLPPTKRAFFEVFLRNRSMLALALKVASWWQWLAPATEGREGNVRHLPTFLEGLSKGRQIPSLAHRQLREILPATVYPPPGTSTRLKVCLFSGCSTEFIYPQVGKKLVEVLALNGCEVHFPSAQGCCGAPVICSGDFDLGRKLADENVEVLKPCEIVVTGCATCSSMLKEYHKYLPDTPEREKAYGELGRKARGMSEFLFKDLGGDLVLPRIKSEYLDKKVTWHDPCHLVRYRNIREEPRRLLKSLGGPEYVELPEADRCCGMAGTFSLYFYETSKKIAERKVECIASTGADIVVTECPGCVMQIADLVAQRKMPQKVMHFLELFE